MKTASVERKQHLAYSITLLFSLLFSFTAFSQQAFYGVTSGNGNGIRFWNSDGYKIHMGNGTEYWFGPVTDYSLKFNMDTYNAGRGWTWGGHGLTPVAGLQAGTGNMQIKGTFTYGGEIQSASTSYTKIQLATNDWGGSHALVFNAYNPEVEVPGNLLATGNIKYANDVGAYNSGAGVIFFEAHAGRMDFLVSPVSTGANTDVVWGVPQLSIIRSGNVGIGISSPVEKLHVYAASGILRHKLENASTTGYSENQFVSNGAEVRLGVSGSGTSGGVGSGGNAYLITNGDKLFLGTSMASEQNVIDAAGNMGIGTAAPSNGRLHVYKNATTGGWGSMTLANAGIRVQDDVASLYLDGNSIYSAGAAMNLGTSDNKNLSLGTNNVERIRISSNGNVGIGTTNLASQLSIHESSAGSNYIRVTNSSTGQGSSNGTIYGIDANNGSSLWNYENTEMYFGTGNQRRMTINSEGKVGIGTLSPDELLTVNGTIHSKEVKVDLNIPAPDYVFSPNYDLRTLEETKAYIETNQHLPEIPSAKEMEANGVALGEMNMLLLKKIEELTLHLIRQEELNTQMAEELIEIRSKLQSLETQSNK